MPQRRLHPLLAVFAGGIVGTAARWSIVVAFDAVVWATFLVNVAGSLALGVFAAWWVQRRHPSDRLSLFLGVGVLGSFTTFSTFSVETVELLREGSLLGGFGYPLLSVAAGLAAATVGAAWGSRR